MIYIIGGGLAGLMLAEALENRGCQWQLYERSAFCGTEASGKNAGIVRTYEADPVIAAVASASLNYYMQHEPSFRKTGILMRPWETTPGIEQFESRPFSHGRFLGYFLPDNGIVQPMEVLSRLCKAEHRYGTISYGSEIEVQVDAAEIILKATNIPRAVLGPGDRLVVAGGEGSVAIADALATPLGLISHQRTLYEYRNVSGYSGPVEWDEESGCYFRPSPDSLIATAGEQIPVVAKYAPGQDRIMSEKSVATLAAQFPLLNAANLTDFRTCRRTMPLDNRPICGPDAGNGQLYWFTGLGGRGVSIAPALAESLAAVICGDKPGFDLAPFSVERIAGGLTL